MIKGTSDHHNLVRQYSNLMKMARAKRKANLIKRADILDRQAKALSTLLNGMPLNLEDCYLCHFDLTGLNLKNMNLKGVSLQGARFSENVFVPAYTDWDRTLLFNKWRDNNHIEKIFYQDLLNAGINFVRGVENIRLQSIEWGKENLKNADFNNTNLSNCNLTGINLKELNLENAFLKNAQLSERVIVPDDITYNSTLLFNKWLNGTDEEKKLYQDLLNAGVHIFYCVDNARLQEIDWANKNLINANFYGADLSNCNLTGVKLKELNLENTSLKGAWLSESVKVPNYNFDDQTLLFEKWINGNKEEKSLFQALLNAGVSFFKGVDNACLQQINWGSKNLKNANFRSVNLENCNFTGANLKKAKLNDACLKNANFEGACLTGAEITVVKLSDRVSSGVNSVCLNLQKIYKFNADSQVKILAKQILKATGCPLEAESIEE